MSRLLILLLLLPAMPLAAQDPEQKFQDKAEEINKQVADGHADLAEFCFRYGWNAAGHAEAERALAIRPEHAKAMQALGYRRRRVDGEQAWVRNERDIPADEDNPDADPRRLNQYEQRRDKARKEAAEGYVELAEFALGLDLEAHARAAWLTALRYDPDNEAARLGAGWVKDEDGNWVSPDKNAEQKATEAALDVPDPEDVDDLPGWTGRVYGAQDVHARRVGKVTAIGAAAKPDEPARYAHAVQAIVADELGGEAGDLRIIITADRVEHEAYVRTRHPAIPGLANDDWIIGRNEVAVLAAENEAETLERVVYAAGIYEVRRRAGETRHPWFEIGMASNLTRRLCGSVATAPFTGEPKFESSPDRWKKALKALVDEREQASLADLIVTRDLAEADVMLAHFVVRYLARRRTAALPAYVAGYRVERDADGAIRSAFGQPVNELEDEFLAWLAID